MADENDVTQARPATAFTPEQEAAYLGFREFYAVEGDAGLDDYRARMARPDDLPLFVDRARAELQANEPVDGMPTLDEGGPSEVEGETRQEEVVQPDVGEAEGPPPAIADPNLAGYEEMAQIHEAVNAEEPEQTKAEQIEIAGVDPDPVLGTDPDDVIIDHSSPLAENRKRMQMLDLVDPAPSLSDEGEQRRPVPQGGHDNMKPYDPNSPESIRRREKVQMARAQSGSPEASSSDESDDNPSDSEDDEQKKKRQQREQQEREAEQSRGNTQVSGFGALASLVGGAVSGVGMGAAFLGKHAWKGLNPTVAQSTDKLRQRAQQSPAAHQVMGGPVDPGAMSSQACSDLLNAHHEGIRQTIHQARTEQWEPGQLGDTLRGPVERFHAQAAGLAGSFPNEVHDAASKVGETLDTLGPEEIDRMKEVVEKIRQMIQSLMERLFARPSMTA